MPLVGMDHVLLLIIVLVMLDGVVMYVILLYVEFHVNMGVHVILLTLAPVPQDIIHQIVPEYAIVKMVEHVMMDHWEMDLAPVSQDIIRLTVRNNVIVKTVEHVMMDHWEMDLAPV